mmetsp:Transcript_1056/g.2098  ORF Transcript_1056/g.2098 Transcript_1056/m.2098 type:complete len:288 (+) Transcript_1056:1742-2605(+)
MAPIGHVHLRFSNIARQGILDHTLDNVSRFLDGIHKIGGRRTIVARIIAWIGIRRVANALHFARAAGGGGWCWCSTIATAATSTARMMRSRPVRRRHALHGHGRGLFGTGRLIVHGVQGFAGRGTNLFILGIALQWIHGPTKVNGFLNSRHGAGILSDATSKLIAGYLIAKFGNDLAAFALDIGVLLVLQFACQVLGHFGAGCWIGSGLFGQVNVQVSGCWGIGAFGGTTEQVAVHGCACVCVECGDVSWMAMTKRGVLCLAIVNFFLLLTKTTHTKDSVVDNTWAS